MYYPENNVLHVLEIHSKLLCEGDERWQMRPKPSDCPALLPLLQDLLVEWVARLREMVRQMQRA